MMVNCSITAGSSLLLMVMMNLLENDGVYLLIMMQYDADLLEHDSQYMLLLLLFLDYILCLIMIKRFTGS